MPGIARIPARVWPLPLPALAVVAGLLVSASLPPFGWWPLGPVGVALVLAGLARGDGLAGRRRFLFGWLAGIAQFVVTISWITEFQAVGYVALVLLEASFLGLACLLTPRRRLWVFPAALVLGEHLRNHFPFGGLPMGGIPIGQAGGPLVPIVRLGGPLLLTGAVGVLAVVLRSAVAGRGLRPRDGIAVLAVVFVAGAGFVWPEPRSRGTLTVAVVQGGGPRGLRRSDAGADQTYRAHLEALRSIPAGTHVDLVLLPEDVIDVDGSVLDLPEGADMAAEARRLHTVLVVGVVEGVGDDAFRNASLAWGPDGQYLGRYDKVHRVPFGEYVPGRSLFDAVADLSIIPRDAIPGKNPAILATPLGTLGSVISFEVFDAGRSRSAMRHGAALLLAPTNASSYTTSQVPGQEVAAAVMRAWETGRDVVQAAPTGFSAIVDHRGVVHWRSRLGDQEVQVDTVETRVWRTPYSVLGEWPFVIVAGALVALASGRNGRRKEPASEPAAG